MPDRLLKTPTQVLQSLKKELKKYKEVSNLIEKGFINKDRFYKNIYDILVSNFEKTNEAFITDEELNLLIKEEIYKSVDLALDNLLNSNLLEISSVNKNGELMYKLSDLGIEVYKNILLNENEKSR
jgi:Glu-tRNA(Gln) amidotransferase subunit E-like FAD-binding protein